MNVASKARPAAARLVEQGKHMQHPIEIYCDADDQAQAEVHFGRDRSVISSEDGSSPGATVAKHATTAADGKTCQKA